MSCWVYADVRCVSKEGRAARCAGTYLSEVSNPKTSSSPLEEDTVTTTAVSTAAAAVVEGIDRLRCCARIAAYRENAFDSRLLVLGVVNAKSGVSCARCGSSGYTWICGFGQTSDSIGAVGGATVEPNRKGKSRRSIFVLKKEGKKKG